MQSCWWPLLQCRDSLASASSLLVLAGFSPLFLNQPSGLHWAAVLASTSCCQVSLGWLCLGNPGGGPLHGGVDPPLTQSNVLCIHAPSVG